MLVALAFLFTCVSSTCADFLAGSNQKSGQQIDEELHGALLTRFKGISDEIADHVKELSPFEAMQLRAHALNIIKAIGTHQTDSSVQSASFGMKEHGETRKSPPPEPPQPSECGVDPDPFPASSNIPIAHRVKIAAEEHVPLTYFEAGYFGNVSSGDPRVFGPDAWRTLHRFSIHYPKHPTVQTQTACKQFLQGLPYMIPCPHCGYHLQEFIVLNDHFSGEEREECHGRCTSAHEICRSQAVIVGFFTRAHNNVNIHNYKIRPNWTASDVYQAYAGGSEVMGPYGPGPTPWTTQGPVDGKCQLIRATVGHNATGSPDFWKDGAEEEVLKNLEVCTQAD